MHIYAKRMINRFLHVSILHGIEPPCSDCNVISAWLKVSLVTLHYHGDTPGESPHLAVNYSTWFAFSLLQTTFLLQPAHTHTNTHTHTHTLTVNWHCSPCRVYILACGPFNYFSRWLPIQSGWGSQPAFSRTVVFWLVTGMHVFGGVDCTPSKPTLWLWYASLFQLNPHYLCQIDTCKHTNGSKPLQIPTSCEPFTIQMQWWRMKRPQPPCCRHHFGNHM